MCIRDRSRALAGKIDEGTLMVKTVSGYTNGEGVNRIGGDSNKIFEVKREHGDIHAFLEIHIEQGPILEMENKNIGIVTGAQAQKWYEISITGMEAHAGPTPMSIRKDALVASAEIVLLVNSIGNNYQPGGCATCGVLEITNPSRNVIPGNCFLTVDLISILYKKGAL